MDKAIGEVMGDFDYAVVGEPNIVVAADLQEIEVFINTNIPNNDAVWKAYESPGDVITIIGTRASYKETPQVGGTRLNSWFNEAIHNRQQVGPEAYVSIDECHRPLYKHCRPGFWSLRRKSLSCVLYENPRNSTER
jgi:hypothetical protein